MKLDPRLLGVLTDGGSPTAGDISEILKFRSFLEVANEAEEHGLSRRDQIRLAAMEVYGNENAESDIVAANTGTEAA